MGCFIEIMPFGRAKTNANIKVQKTHFSLPYPNLGSALQTGGQSSSAQPHEVATPTLQMIDPRSHKMSGPWFVMLSLLQTFLF
jgi:hypothetical protein